jgi:hypothetical protein
VNDRETHLQEVQAEAEQEASDQATAATAKEWEADLAALRAQTRAERREAELAEARRAREDNR